MSQFSQSKKLLNNIFTASKYTQTALTSADPPSIEVFSIWNTLLCIFGRSRPSWHGLVGVFDPNAGDVYVVDPMGRADTHRARAVMQKVLVVVVIC